MHRRQHLISARTVLAGRGSGKRSLYRALAGGLSLCCLAGTGCSSAVELPAPAPSGEAAQQCAGLLPQLPKRVHGQQARETEPANSLTAAWGDPPITLSCGVAEPSGMQTDTRCFEVNGVGWYAEQGQGGWLFTTIGRAATVQVGVPAAYAPEANVLVELAAPIQAHDRLLKPCL